MKLSDSLCLICLSPSSVVRHTLDTSKETQGLPGCRVIAMSNMPWSPTPGSRHHLAFNGDDCVDFHLLKNVVLPTRKITGLNPFNLSAYGLSARYPTLKTLRYHKASKDSLPGGWPTFRDGFHTRWTTRPCPAALNIFPKTLDSGSGYTVTIAPQLKPIPKPAFVSDRNQERQKQLILGWLLLFGCNMTLLLF